jgi:Domain of unknown function (DUF5664)
MKQSTNPKDRIGRTKPQLHLIPATALLVAAEALTLGAKKYGPFNWRGESVSASVYVDAIARHLWSYFDGEDVDHESGVSHLGHVIACAAILLDAESQGKLVDDRPAKGKTAEMIRKLTKVSDSTNIAKKVEQLVPGNGI